MVTQEQIGKAIIRLRKQRGLSQEKFALESGIDRRYLSDVENGKRNVSFELLNRVSSYFGISLSSFIAEAERSQLFSSSKELENYLSEQGAVEAVFFTEPYYFEAIIGLSQDSRLVYSYPRMVDSLMINDQMTFEDAVDFVNYNTLRSLPHMGNHAPIIVFNTKD